MSIINDAIKKARREFEIKKKVAAPSASGPSVPGKVRPVKAVSVPSEVKWTVVVVVSLVVIVSIFGSILLYGHLSRSTLRHKPVARPRVKKGIPVAVKKILPKTEYRPEPISRPRYSETRIEDMVELNGIVCGPKDRWAIINNKITREGDDLLGGKLVLIEKDHVRIKKENGEEVILELR